MVNTNKLKIGITGGTGYLGNRLIELLADKNVEITCFVRESSRVLQNNSVKYFKGDLLSVKSLQSFVEDKNVIIHLAAQVSHTTKEKYYLTNQTGTENICKAIESANPGCRLIFCSSIAAYRIKGLIKVHFTDYAKSKLAADKIVDLYMSKIKATTIVPGLIYGAGKNVFISAIIENLKNNKLFFAKGGEHYAPLSYIDDLCDLFIKAAFNEDSAGNKYFGINYSEKGIHEFIRMIARRLNYDYPQKIMSKRILMTKAVIYTYIYKTFKINKIPKMPVRMVDVLSINYKLSESQRKNNIGWTPKVSMEEGVDIVTDLYDLCSIARDSKLKTM